MLFSDKTMHLTKNYANASPIGRAKYQLCRQCGFHHRKLLRKICIFLNINASFKKMRTCQSYCQWHWLRQISTLEHGSHHTPRKPPLPPHPHHLTRVPLTPHARNKSRNWADARWHPMLGWFHPRQGGPS